MERCETRFFTFFLTKLRSSNAENDGKCCPNNYLDIPTFVDKFHFHLLFSEEISWTDFDPNRWIFELVFLLDPMLLLFGFALLLLRKVEETLAATFLTTENPMGQAKEAI